MRVLFYTYPLAFQHPGGGETLLVKSREYFGDHAEYVDPRSPDSILRGVNLALAGPRNGDLASHLLDRFQWDRIAMATRDA